MRTKGCLLYQRGEAEMEYLTFIVIFGLFIWWVIADIGEREGSVKYEDCRETVNLPPNNLKQYYKTFTCLGGKTRGGTKLAGDCVHIEYVSTWFSDSNLCKVAFIYERPQGGNCTDPKFPKLGYDDKCYPNSWQ